MHLTEKIFKPIVNKQPFMLLAAPDNLAYLKSYGFKTYYCLKDGDKDRRSIKERASECNLKIIKLIKP